MVSSILALYMEGIVIMKTCLWGKKTFVALICMLFDLLTNHFCHLIMGVLERILILSFNLKCR